MYLVIFSVLGSLGQNKNTNQNRCNKDYSYFRWDHGDKLMYYELTRQSIVSMLSQASELANYCIVSQVALRSETSSVTGIDKKYIVSEVNRLYDGVIKVLNDSAMQTIPKLRTQALKFWWNEELNELKEKAIEAKKLWVQAGRPRSGPVFDNQKIANISTNLPSKTKNNESSKLLLTTYMIACYRRM